MKYVTWMLLSRYELSILCSYNSYWYIIFEKRPHSSRTKIYVSIAKKQRTGKRKKMFDSGCLKWPIRWCLCPWFLEPKFLEYQETSITINNCFCTVLIT